MKKMISLGMFILSFFVMVACGNASDDVLRVDVYFTEAVSDLTFTSDQDIAVTWVSDTQASLAGLSLNQVITLNHPELAFNPASFSVNRDLAEITITVILTNDDQNQTEDETQSEDGDDDDVPGDDASDDTPVEDSDEPSDTPVDDSDDPDDTPVDDSDEPGDTPVDDSDEPDDTPVDDSDEPGDTPVDDSDEPDDTPVDDSDEPSDSPSDEDDEDEARALTVEVSTIHELEEALGRLATGLIVYLNDIAGDVVIEGQISLDLGGFTHAGSIELSTDEAGDVIFDNGTLSGDLIIDAGNVSMVNHLTVSGEIYIEAVASSSFYERGEGNAIIVRAVNSFVSIESTASRVVIEASHVRLEVSAELIELVVIENVQNVDVFGAAHVLEAIIESENIFMDDLPQLLSGAYLPAFDRDIVEAIVLPSIDAFNHGTDLEAILSTLPSSVVIETESGMSYTVDVLDFTVTSAIDEETIEAQMIDVVLVLDWPSDVINAHFLIPELTIDVLSVRDSFEALDYIWPEADETFEHGEASSLEELVDLLPSHIYVGWWFWQHLPAKWTLVEGEFDPESIEETILTFRGTVAEVPEGYHDLDLEPIYITVTILERDDDWWLVEPDAFVHIQTKYPEAVSWTYSKIETDYTIEVTVHFNVLSYDYRIDHLQGYANGELGGITDVVLPTMTFNRSPNRQFPLHLIIRVTPLERPDVSEIFAGGTGTAADPFVITNHIELQNMKYYLDGPSHFVLGNDIVIPEDFDFEPLRTPNPHRPFSGSFDGQGFSIYGYRVVYTEEDDVSSAAFMDDNHGTIKNINFRDVHVVNPGNIARDGVVTSSNHGLMKNITVTGYREGLGTGLAGINGNSGVIENVTIDMELRNANAGITYSNHGIIKNSTVDVGIYITKINIGRIAGVAGLNTPSGHLFETIGVGRIEHVHATVYIEVDLEAVPDLFSDGLDIGGFVYWNDGTPHGHDESVRGRILHSSINVNIRMVGEHRAGVMGGFVAGNAGYIANSSATGYIEGANNIGGFAASNGSRAELNNVFADVEVVASDSYAGGLVAHNRTTPSGQKGIIRDSEARGNVTGTTRKGVLVGRNQGEIIDSDGFGSLFEYQAD